MKLYIFFATFSSTPSTDFISSRLADSTARADPKWFNRALFLIDPMPSIWSNKDLLIPLFLFALWALIAKRWDSSLILWRKKRVGSFLLNLYSLPLWKKVSLPLFLNFPLAIAIIGISWSPNSFKESLATEYWPFRRQLLLNQERRDNCLFLELLF